MATLTNRTIWWCLVVSLLVYVVVAHVASVRTDSAVSIPILLGALGAISVGVAIGTLKYRRHALVGPIQRCELDLTSSAGQAKAFQV